MRYYIDNVKIQPKETNEAEKVMTISGWAVSDSPDIPVKITVCNQRKEPVHINRTDTARYDVNQNAFHGESQLKLGFCIQFEYQPGHTYYMTFTANGKKLKEKLKPGDHRKSKGKQLPRLQALCRPATICRGFSFLKRYGLSAFLKNLYGKLKGDRINYNSWQKQILPTPEELEIQRKTSFPCMPKFSIVVPLHRTPDSFLREMIHSVQAQTYENWELCLADGSRDTESAHNTPTDTLAATGEASQARIHETVAEYQKTDSRIHYQALSANFGIAGNTNEALAMATGDYIVLLDHDDTLTPDALYACACCINQGLDTGKDIDVLYSDEDKVTIKKNHPYYLDPHFKPDFNPDLLRSMNYICHLFVVKKDLADQVGSFRQEFDGAQDYDFIFRCTEKATHICHIPRVLYHWRVSDQSTAMDPEKKRYAFEAGARAIKSHCERIGIGPVEVQQNEVLGTYRVIYPIKGTPKVSIIIPNKDHIKDLKVCLDSVLERASYKNVEVIIVENNSTQEETFLYYKKLEADYDNLKVITWKNGTGFNFSALNNYAVSFATGEYLLFLNNDTEFINQDCIEEMLGFCQRDDVGIVGAKLFYDDDTIQHAGVVVGFGDIAGHTFIGFHKEEKTYFLRASCAQDYSAVTAACMMTKRSLFEEVGGFYEKLAVAFNDIDYCLKVRKIGKRVVYNPFAQLYHYESKSRGLEDTPEKALRSEQEIETFRNRWPEILKNGDPYYNPNLTLLRSDFSLRNFEKEPLKKQKSFQQS